MMFTDLPRSSKTKDVGGFTFSFHEDAFVDHLWREVFEEKIYHAGGFAPRPGEVVVDVGAGFGAFSADASNALRVIAIEPSPVHFDYLEWNLMVNACSNVSAFCFGLGARTEEREFFLHSNGNLSLFPFTLSREEPPAEKALCLSIKDALRVTGVCKVDLLRIDCEGSDSEIISGFDDEVASSIGRIVLEYHDVAGSLSHAEMVNRLSLLGYECRLSPFEDVKPADYHGLLFAKKR